MPPMMPPTIAPTWLDFFWFPFALDDPPEDVAGGDAELDDPDGALIVTLGTLHVR